MVLFAGYKGTPELDRKSRAGAEERHHSQRQRRRLRTPHLRGAQKGEWSWAGGCLTGGSLGRGGWMVGLGSVYTKRQRQSCDNSAMTVAILFSLKTIVA